MNVSRLAPDWRAALTAVAIALAMLSVVVPASADPPEFGAGGPGPTNITWEALNITWE